jgi:UDP-N-acetyl-D-glucosamine dehydrogenase
MVDDLIEASGENQTEESGPNGETPRRNGGSVGFIRRILSTSDLAVADQREMQPGFLSSLPVVCVQGLGFVGAAVCIAIASARDPAGRPVYCVAGIDLPTPDGFARIAALCRGEFPFVTTDATLAAKAREAHATGNITACTDPETFASADIIIVDVPLDARLDATGPVLDLAPFCAAISAIGRHMRPDALVIIETTVPPGTTSRVVAPIVQQELRRRGLPEDRFRLAHCYERVTPGAAYLDSIINMPRVYAGRDDHSAKACESFLLSIGEAERSSPTRLASTTASELGKVLENTFRAVTIGLMDEFAAFAEAIGVDLFEVIEPIRARASHSNIRTPGFGVGGYCLTKDPLLAPLAARDLYGLEPAFPLAMLSVQVNEATPRRIIRLLRRLLDDSLVGRRILLLGISYRPDVGDTRRSPSQVFYETAKDEGAEVKVHDPLVAYWPEQALEVPRTIPSSSGIDAVVLAVPHRQYKDFDYVPWLGASRPLFLDTFNVLSFDQRRAIRELGCRVESVGRGCGL